MRAKKVDSYEVRLKQHFESAVERMNRELPQALRILYRPFDMKSQENSSAIYDVFARLAESVVARVGFLHSSTGDNGVPRRVQSGVVRTNCVDCLDRTNVLQFFVGLEVLKQQLTALNLLPEPRLEYDSPVVFVLSELYDIMGDHLALQYAGSVAHKKYQLLGSRPRMMTSSKELLTSIHRHYNNSFTDSEKQASLNLFLGTYQARNNPRLWELDCDSWLHHGVLRDDYNPGDWWEEPLRIHAENMEYLKSPICAVLPVQSQIDWFREIYDVCKLSGGWKLTCFDQFLNQLDSTCVQINASSRRISNLRPSKSVAKRGQRGELSFPRKLVREKRHARPREVAAGDMEVYKSYVDPRQLSRLMRPSVPVILDTRALDISGAKLRLTWPEQKGSSLQEVFRGSEGVPGSPQRFMRWFVRSYLACHLHRERPRPRMERRNTNSIHRSPLIGTLNIVPTMIHSKSAVKPIRLQLCSYCDAPYDQDAAKHMITQRDEKERRRDSEQSSTHSQQQARQQPEAEQEHQNHERAHLQRRLCMRHQQRALDLDRYVRQSDLPLTGRWPEESCNRGIKVSIPEKKNGQKTWEGWLRRVDTSKPDRGRESENACEEGRLDVMNPLENTFASKELQAAMHRHYWSYAFPHEEPVAPSKDELGVPQWWLRSLNARPQPSLPSDGERSPLHTHHRSKSRDERGLQERRGRRRDSSSSKYLPAGARTSSPEPRRMAAREAQAWTPPRAGRSIFSGFDARKELDELQADASAGESVCGSPVRGPQLAP
eukprot:TRINITY_DN32949_c0_g1_i1.p1 TRINITY_DN32949_c0_g1~~TRINITY_DN32949_c0_g1_i1.p1  ORF type:complete len:772 (+),score=98.28 TRINITY_DN32949_c0_g1_i1:1107-3422(+)